MGWVYLIQDIGSEKLYKIGATRGKIEKRLKALQTGNGNELVLRCGIETERPFMLEKMLHNRFENKHLMNEWYNLDLEDVKEFENICKGALETAKVLENNYFVGKKYNLGSYLESGTEYGTTCKKQKRKKYQEDYKEEDNWDS